MWSYSIRFSVSCRVYGADGAVHGTIRTVHTTNAAALKTTTHPKTRCRKPYDATQHLMLLMMGVCTRNMSIQEYINRITLLLVTLLPCYFLIESFYIYRKLHLYETGVIRYIQRETSLSILHEYHRLEPEV